MTTGKKLVLKIEPPPANFRIGRVRVDNALKSSQLDEVLKVLRENDEYIRAHGIGQGFEKRSLWWSVKHFFTHRHWQRGEWVFYNQSDQIPWSRVFLATKLDDCTQHAIELAREIANSVGTKKDWETSALKLYENLEKLLQKIRYGA
jgi:hypothetical protein